MPLYCPFVSYESNPLVQSWGTVDNKTVKELFHKKVDEYFLAFKSETKFKKTKVIE